MSKVAEFFFLGEKLNTVELGYNDHGYSEFTATANKILRNFRSQIVTLLHKASRL